MSRIEPLQPPFPTEIQERLDRRMPKGTAPLVLFTTLARDKRLFETFMAGSLLDRGHLTLRQREIVIDRVTALCRSEYEWGEPDVPISGIRLSDWLHYEAHSGAGRGRRSRHSTPRSWWIVHVAFFANRANLDEDQVASTVNGGKADPVWRDEERALLAACDQLHQNCDIDDETWRHLRRHFSEEALLEIVMLAGRYRMVSYLTNALRLPLESYAARFPKQKHDT